MSRSEDRSLISKSSGRAIGPRTCSRSGCRQVASKTLTYIYRDSQAILTSLAMFAEPHSYDLCEVHSHRLSLPQGWTIKKEIGAGANPGPSKDDLMAIADAVREAGQFDAEVDETLNFKNNDLGRRGHLRSVPNF
jgi:Protein of unknown function (DUF3499)